MRHSITTATGTPSRRRPGALAYLWAHPYGRLAIAAIALGLVTILFHYWVGPLLLHGLRLDRRALAGVR